MSVLKQTNSDNTNPGVLLSSAKVIGVPYAAGENAVEYVFDPLYLKVNIPLFEL
jgi:hypothetical protein